MDASFAYDFFDFLISKKLQEYFFNLFEEHQDLKSYFYHDYCTRIKFFRDANYKIYGKSFMYDQSLMENTKA